MFDFLGHFVRRAWPYLLAGWVAALLLTSWAAPNWDKLAQDREFSFLPPDVQSVQAEKVFATAFADDKSSSNIVLVLHRTTNDPKSLPQTLKFIETALQPGLLALAKAEGGLASEIVPSSGSPFGSDPFGPEEGAAQPATEAKQPSLMSRIRTPLAPGVGALLVSPDEQVLLVVVELTTEFLSRENWGTIDKVTQLIDELRQAGKLPDGLEIAMTGSALIGRDHTVAELQSVKVTGILTVVLVAVLLIVIYRAPLLAVIPLFTVYLAVKISLNILALLAGAGYITIFQGLQIYITILAYGAGVDYSLFLTARYREELDRGTEPHEAVARAIGGVGAALTASAATVIGGIAMMLFAQFGKFREAGFAIPLCLFLVLAATMTFSPALLCLAGRWSFWPQHLRAANESGGAVGSVSGNPGWFSKGGFIEQIWLRVGELLLRRATLVWIITVVLMTPFAIVAGLLHNFVSYDVIGTLPSNASGTLGTQLLEKHFSPGLLGPVTVLVVDPQVEFDKEPGRRLVKQLTEQLSEQKASLGLADVRSLTSPLGITPESHRDYSGVTLTEAERREGTETQALAHYVTALGERKRIGTRLELVPSQSPFTRQSIENLDRIEQVLLDTLPATQRADTKLYFVGTTAGVRDVARVMQTDRRRIEWLVLVSVFVILVLLLRRFWVPLYLLLSVLFSYFTTLGVAFAVFWLLDPHGFTGIDWKVAIFLFTILIAVGEDYNIFLMTRIDEETKRYGPLRGITEALDRTGPIISSCGIIMAGTFASLLVGSLTEMKQLGFSLAFGVILDTFVVRPILVPAFLIMLRARQLSPEDLAKASAPVTAKD